MVNNAPSTVQPRSAFSSIALLAVVIVAIALLTTALFAALTMPHVLGEVQSLIHSATSGGQSIACGVLPGTCYSPRA